jgi:hypothetical protein
MWEKRRCVGARKGSNGVLVIKLLCFMWLSPFFKHVQSEFPEFALVQALVSVNVVWVLLQFNGFPDESVHVSGFWRKNFCVI